MRFLALLLPRKMLLQASLQASLLEAAPLVIIYKLSGILLFSRAVSSTVPSAVYALTVVFGMGTGVSHIRIDTGQFCLFSFGLSPMGLSGLEPPTSRLSGVRSNRLSYKPLLSPDHQTATQLLLLLFSLSFRKEVIQPHLPIRLPCYDFTPVTRPAFDRSFLAVKSRASGIPDSHGVTGGVYKTRERIHRDILIRDY